MFSPSEIDKKFKLEGRRGETFSDSRKRTEPIVWDGLLDRRLGVESSNVSSSLKFAVLRGEVAGDATGENTGDNCISSTGSFAFRDGCRRCSSLCTLSIIFCEPSGLLGGIFCGEVAAPVLAFVDAAPSTEEFVSDISLCRTLCAKPSPSLTLSSPSAVSVVGGNARKDVELHRDSLGGLLDSNLFGDFFSVLPIPSTASRVTAYSCSSFMPAPFAGSSGVGTSTRSDIELRLDNCGDNGWGGLVSPGLAGELAALSTFA